MKKVTGNDLIKLGYKPAKWFGEALSILNPEPWEDPFEVTEDMIRVVCDKLLNV
jgi:hypothetical protein